MKDRGRTERDDQVDQTLEAAARVATQRAGGLHITKQMDVACRQVLLNVHRMLRKQNKQPPSRSRQSNHDQQTAKLASASHHRCHHQVEGKR